MDNLVTRLYEGTANTYSLAFRTSQARMLLFHESLESPIDYPDSR